MMKNIIWIITAVLLCASCSDFLEPKSQSEYTAENATQLNELLLGVAYPGPTINANRSTNTMTTLLDVLSDDVSGGGYHSSAETRGYYDKALVKSVKAAYSWQPDYSRKMYDAGLNEFNAYSSIYDRLAGANAVIDLVDDISDTQDNINLVLGQAYALRGFYYLHLVNMYGEPFYYNPDGLAVPLKLTSYVEERPMVRNTVREVYDQVIKDLLAAEACFLQLPESMQYKKDYRANLWMTRHILARAYLYMENWEGAATYAEKLIDNGSFTLLNLESLVNAGYTNHRAGTGANDKRKFYNFITYDNPECYWVYGSSNEMTRFTGSIIDRAANTTSSAYLMQASQDLLDSFEAGDTRKQLYFVTDIYTNRYINITGYGSIGKYPINLGDNNLYAGSGTSVFGQALRKSEAYVIAAEANAMRYRKEGDAAAGTKAVSQLNELRSKRFLAANYRALALGDFASPEELVDFVRAERRREMCFEALRWFDQRRYGMKKVERLWYTGPGTSSASNIHYEKYVLEENDPLFTLPIPHTVLQNNSDLQQESTEGSERLPVETI